MTDLLRLVATILWKFKKFPKSWRRCKYAQTGSTIHTKELTYNESSYILPGQVFSTFIKDIMFMCLMMIATVFVANSLGLTLRFLPSFSDFMQLKVLGGPWE